MDMHDNEFSQKALLCRRLCDDEGPKMQKQKEINVLIKTKKHHEMQVNVSHMFLICSCYNNNGPDVVFIINYVQFDS